jgi:hypothetical protein
LLTLVHKKKTTDFSLLDFRSHCLYFSTSSIKNDGGLLCRMKITEWEKDC